MSATRTAFALAHAGWHNHWAWARFMPLLGANKEPTITNIAVPSLAEQSAEALWVSTHEHG
jgi:hypothetical protein